MSSILQLGLAILDGYRRISGKGDYAMLPKAQYMKLSPLEKKAVKAAIAQKVTGKGAYSKNFVRHKGTTRGNGDFFDDLAGAGAKLLAGAARGVVKKAGQFIGMGDYRPRRNFVRGKGDFFVPRGMPNAGTLAPASVPLMAKSGRSNLFTYREYLGDVYSSVNFASTVFNINPGLGDPGSTTAGSIGLFPWLSPIAANYEQYRLEGAILEFISTSSDAVVSGATTSSLGQVCMATQYNTNQQGFTSLTEALNSQFATTEKPSVNFCHVIECAPREKPQNVQYVRTAPLTSNEDVLQYDMGQVNLITQGMPVDGEVIGQLWITYRCSLFKPILGEPGGSPDPVIESAHYSYDNNHTDVASATLWGTHSGNMSLVSNAGDLKIGFSYASGSELTFTGMKQNSNYLLTFVIRGGVAATMPNVVSVGSVGAGLTAFNYPDSTVVIRTPPISTDMAYVQMFQYAFLCINPSPSICNIVFGTSASLPGTIVDVQVSMTEISPTFSKAPVPELKRGNFWRGTKQHPMAPWRSQRMNDSKAIELRKVVESEEAKWNNVYNALRLIAKARGDLDEEEGDAKEQKVEKPKVFNGINLSIKPTGYDDSDIEDEAEDDRLMEVLVARREARAARARASKKYVKVEEPEQTPKPSTAPASTSKKA